MASKLIPIFFAHSLQVGLLLHAMADFCHSLQVGLLLHAMRPKDGSPS
jgi:hypothetical protein